jgi:hypothetical protein
MQSLQFYNKHAMRGFYFSPLRSFVSDVATTLALTPMSSASWTEFDYTTSRRGESAMVSITGSRNVHPKFDDDING